MHRRRNAQMGTYMYLHCMNKDDVAGGVGGGGEGWPQVTSLECGPTEKLST